MFEKEKTDTFYSKFVIISKRAGDIFNERKSDKRN